MKAEIIAIGSELTCGARLDTNSQWLSQELESRGITVTRHTTVADDRDAMIRIYREAAHHAQVVLITGGLGPTLDDITRETLAEAFHQPLVEDAEALAHIESMFRAHKRHMPERNRVQALRPANAETIHNAHGTAPGILMNLDEHECVIGVMPGVPAEMKRMFHEQLLPRLPVSNMFVRRTMIRTFGHGESATERRLGDLTARGRNPEVGITASQAVISLSITARANSDAECQQLTEEVRSQIFEKLGDNIFGEGDVELHEIVGEQLVNHRKTLALLEGPTTGGLIGQWLTERDDFAQQLTWCQLFPTAPPAATNGDWETALRNRAEELLNDGTDYVVITSPTRLEDQGRMRKQHGNVIVLGSGLEVDQDVSMSGNLEIFRNRAARNALNHIRLHLLRSPG